MKINRSSPHVVEYVDDLLHDVLDPQDAAWVREHCQHCSVCAAALHEATQRQQALASLPVREVSEQLISQSLNRVQLQSQRRGRWRSVWQIAALATAAAVLLIGGAHWHFYRLAPTNHDLRVLGQTTFLPGSQSSLRVAVYDVRTDQPLSGIDARLQLRDRHDGRTIQLASFRITQPGEVTPRFRLPEWADGSYDLVLSTQGTDFEESLVRPIQLQRSWKLMLSTDKPVYQPGQTIHLRSLSLGRPSLKPVANQACEFTIIDPKGNIVFRQSEGTSRFGIAACDCQLATEINEGTYQIQCRIGDSQARRTVEVHRYVLPKFGVALQLDQVYYESGQTMQGSLQANYFFGQPTKDAQVQLELRAVDVESYRIDLIEGRTDANGEMTFQFVLPSQLVGRPQDGGAARVELTAVVTDSAGQVYSTKATRVVTDNPIQLEVIPESGRLVAGVPNRVYVYASYPDGRPARVRIITHGLAEELRTNDLGIAMFPLTPTEERISLTMKATDDDGRVGQPKHVVLRCGRGSGDYLVRTDRAVYDGGATMNLLCLGGGPDPVFIDFVKDGQTLLTQQVEMSGGQGQLQLELPAEIFGTVQIIAHRFDDRGFSVRKSRTVFVRQPNELRVSATMDKPEYRPGETAKLRLALQDSQGMPVQGAISLAAVDEAVFSVLNSSTSMQRVFFLLENELLEPVYAIYNWDPASLLEVTSTDRTDFEQALFSRTATQSRSRYSLAAFSFPAKDDLVQRQRASGLRAVGYAWAGLVVAWLLLGATIFAITRPIAFLVTAVAGIMLLLLTAPMLFLAARMDAMRANTGSAAGVEDAAPDAMAGDDGGEPALRVRQSFPETLLWQPELITDEYGRYVLDVPLADSITTWRVSASAVSASGQLGAQQVPLRVFQPFFVDLNLPAALTRNDQFAVPVVVYNYLDREQEVELTIDKADWFSWVEQTPGESDSNQLQRSLTLAAGEVRAVRIPIQVHRVGQHAFRVTARAGQASDAIQRTVEVVPNGTLVEQSSSGLLAPLAESEFFVPEHAVPGSVQAFVKLYPSSFSQLVEGLDAVFQMPYGCFEQTSSTTYPNVLALDYLRRINKSSPQVEAKARQYIHLGYQRLVSFEVRGGGFDWFGNPPANVTLTAYGLMEFQDMARVHEVDPALIDRTRQWLLSQRQGDGSWKSDQRTFRAVRSQAPDGGDLNLVTTAYVAMAVFGDGQSLDRAGPTLDYLLAHPADSIEQPYLLALMIRAISSIDAEHPRLAAYVERLQSLKQTSADGKRIWWQLPAESETVFHGSGQSGEIEATAMACLALMQVQGPTTTIQGALRWIAEQKDANGTWHSTQATVLALQALLAGSRYAAGDDQTRQISIALDGQAVRQIEIQPQQSDVVQLVDLSEQLSAGSHRLVIQDDSDTATGFQTVFRYHTEMPIAADVPTVDTEPLTIQITYDRQRLAVDETVTAECLVRNNMDQTAPMVIVDLPIPAGFELDAGELDELRGSQLIEKYQVTARKAIVYLRGLDPRAIRRLRYRLKATTPVKVSVPPAQVYEYYDPSKRGRSAAVELIAT